MLFWIIFAASYFSSFVLHWEARTMEESEEEK